MHITLTGNLGSGKSTISKILNETYGFEVYSTGKVQRQIASEMNISTLELNQLMCSDHKYDNMIDDTTARISRENKDKDIVFDSRLAWHFVESSFKVFLSINLDVAAGRVFKDDRGAVEKYASIEEAKEMLRERAQTEKRRYKDIYDLDYFNFNNYNLVIDTTYCLPEQIATVIMEQARLYEKSDKDTTNILICPKSLLSESDITKANQEELASLVSKYKDRKQIVTDKVKASKTEEGFKIVDGKEIVKAAYLAEVSYLLVELA